MSQKQCTIANATSLKGIGLHTGVEVTLTLNPASENHGFKFRRTDLEGQPIIDALAENTILEVVRSGVSGIARGEKVLTI